MTQFRARWLEKTYYELALDAVTAALRDARIGPDRVATVTYGIYKELFERQIMPDVYVHDYLGLRLKPSTRVTAGGATGGAAIRTGILEILSGEADVALVVGVEKATDCYNYEVGAATPETLKAISYSADMSFENPLGFTAAASFAIPMIAHMRKYGAPTEEQMAKVSVKNHRNAKLNPISQSPKDITVEDVLSSRMVCYPFKFYDNCLYSEGAAALVLASERVARTEFGVKGSESSIRSGPSRLTWSRVRLRSRCSPGLRWAFRRPSPAPGTPLEVREADDDASDLSTPGRPRKGEP